MAKFVQRATQWTPIKEGDHESFIYFVTLVSPLQNIHPIDLEAQ
jgi:hypothetical protein